MFFFLSVDTTTFSFKSLRICEDGFHLLFTHFFYICTLSVPILIQFKYRVRINLSLSMWCLNCYCELWVPFLRNSSLLPSFCFVPVFYNTRYELRLLHVQFPGLVTKLVQHAASFASWWRGSDINLSDRFLQTSWSRTFINQVTSAFVYLSLMHCSLPDKRVRVKIPQEYDSAFFAAFFIHSLL